MNKIDMSSEVQQSHISVTIIDRLKWVQERVKSLYCREFFIKETEEYSVISVNLP